MAGRWFEPKPKGKLQQWIADAGFALRQRFLKKGKGTSALRNFSESQTFRQMRVKLLNLTLAFGTWFQLSAMPVLRRFNWKFIQGLLAVLVVSFFAASSISTFAANRLLLWARGEVKVSPKKGSKSASSQTESEESNVLGSVALGSPVLANTVAIRKEILARNLFNSEGKLAPEAGKDDNKPVRKDLSIDFEKVECTSSELPVEINGTIYTGDPLKSFVILKDPKIADADIYKAGDAIIDHEDHEIYKVERGMLEVRKGNSKICVAISGYGKKNTSSDSGAATSSSAKVTGESKEFEFDAAFISQEIGPGYATILNCAKLIPDIDSSGKMQGFKMISIATGCLFDRIQIQNGDVVTEVNGISLKDPGQGFKLYQSLQEERTTTINILRSNEPITRIIRVK